MNGLNGKHTRIKGGATGIDPETARQIAGFNEYAGGCASIGSKNAPTWGQRAIKRMGEPEDVTGAILF